MDECIDALETSPWALPSDKLLCKHIRLQRATDEHSRKVSASHLFRPASTSGPDTHEIVDDFRRQLANREDSSLSNRNNGNVFNSLRRAIQRLIKVPLTRFRYSTNAVLLVKPIYLRSSRGRSSHCGWCHFQSRRAPRGSSSPAPFSSFKNLVTHL